MTYGFREQYYPPMRGTSLKILLILLLIHLQRSRILYDFLVLANPPFHLNVSHNKYLWENVAEGENLFTVGERSNHYWNQCGGFSKTLKL